MIKNSLKKSKSRTIKSKNKGKKKKSKQLHLKSLKLPNQWDSWKRYSDELLFIIIWCISTITTTESVTWTHSSRLIFKNPILFKFFYFHPFSSIFKNNLLYQRLFHFFLFAFLGEKLFSTENYRTTIIFKIFDMNVNRRITSCFLNRFFLALNTASNLFRSFGKSLLLNLFFICDFD